MTKWHRTWRGDLGLRAAGSGLCALSYVSFAHVLRLHAGHPVQWTPGLAAYLLTAIGVLSASAGSAMTALGSHLFDEIVISERWRVKPKDDRAEAGDDPFTSSAGPVGRSYPTRFPTIQAVRRPDDHRGGRPTMSNAMAGRADAATRSR